MKAILNTSLLIFALMFLGLGHSFAQQDLTGKMVRIIKQDGNVLIGEFASDDGREILLITENLGKIYIPKHEVESINLVDEKDTRDGKYVGEDRFATRYFITTNGLPIKKGEHYAMLGVQGPEVHFAFADNLSVGLLSVWVAGPLIGSLKLSLNSDPESKVNASIGVLGGGLPFFGGYGALGYGALTFGDRTSNLTVSAGYAGINDGLGSRGAAPLMSVAGMHKIDDKWTFVGDSFIYLGTVGEENGGTWALVMPGLRYSKNGRFAIQFGVAGLVIPELGLPVAPFPIGNLFFALN